MSENILEKIIKNKKNKVDLLKKSLSIENLKIKIDENKSFIDFKEKIKNNEKLIVEFDKLQKKVLKNRMSPTEASKKILQHYIKNNKS